MNENLYEILQSRFPENRDAPCLVLPDGARAPIIVRLLNPVLNCLGTELTRRLGLILAGTGLRIMHEEPAGIRGLLKIVLARKPSG